MCLPACLCVINRRVAEHTLAGAKVRSELEAVPQAMVEKWLTQIETYRHKIQDW